jgi:hypothetical protein
MFLLGCQYPSNISQSNSFYDIKYMVSIKNDNYLNLPRTTTKKSAISEEKMGDVTLVDETEVAVKIWDDHIERLEAKLSFLITSYDGSNSDLLYQYEKKVSTIKREISDAIDQREALIGRGKLLLLSNR